MRKPSWQSLTVLNLPSLCSQLPYRKPWQPPVSWSWNSNPVSGINPLPLVSLAWIRSGPQVIVKVSFLGHIQVSSPDNTQCPRETEMVGRGRNSYNGFLFFFLKKNSLRHICLSIWLPPKKDQISLAWSLQRGECVLSSTVCAAIAHRRS